MSKAIELLLQLLSLFKDIYRYYKKEQQDNFKRDVHNDPVGMLCKQLNPNSKPNATSNASSSREHSTSEEQQR